MAGAPFRQLAARVRGEALGAERHCLVDAHIATDDRRLADHDARAMVDEEVRADLRSWMDVDPGRAVGEFRHDPRQQWNAQGVQAMREAMVDADAVRTTHWLAEPGRTGRGGAEPVLRLTPSATVPVGLAATVSVMGAPRSLRCPHPSARHAHDRTANRPRAPLARTLSVQRDHLAAGCRPTLQPG